MADGHTFELRPGRSGRAEGPAGLCVAELSGFGLASVMARHGRAADAAQRAAVAYGVALPGARRSAHGAGATLLWTGPGHWLALLPQADDIETRLGAVFGDTAAVFDQSDSRVLLELRGARARDTLAKGVPVDLHPRVFAAGDVAITTAAHVGLLLWQVADDPVYRLLTVRTWFGSFAGWLTGSAAEYGCEVLPARPYSAHQD